jgi:adenine phosphoribosyltransferase
MTQRTSEERLALISRFVRDVPDFPKPGILFKDITPLLASHDAFIACLELFDERFRALAPDVVVGVESRGFIFGAALAARLGTSFVPARKPNKLPWDKDRVEYELEYGKDAVEMHRDAIAPGARVLVIDDLIATGGTAWAACELVRRQGGNLIGAGFVIELGFLAGRARIAPVDVYAILRF